MSCFQFQSFMNLALNLSHIDQEISDYSVQVASNTVELLLNEQEMQYFNSLLFYDFLVRHIKYNVPVTRTDFLIMYSYKNIIKHNKITSRSIISLVAETFPLVKKQKLMVKQDSVEIESSRGVMPNFQKINYNDKIKEELRANHKLKQRFMKNKK